MPSDCNTHTWRVGPDHVIDLSHPVLMGVLNVTPDSFSDGGRFNTTDAAIEWAGRLIEQGASIIDVGGESTRPGAVRIHAKQQMQRTLDVISGINDKFDVLISVDTTLAEVAEAALDAGANIINDQSAGRDSDSMFTLAAERECGLVLMQRLRAPEDDSFSDRYTEAPRYDDVVITVRDFLHDRRNAAIAAGVPDQGIVLDPGLGFGKTVEQNFELIQRTHELLELGRPVLSAASRKSFIGRVTGVNEPANRVTGSTAVSVAHALQGVRLFRVHDVAAHREALCVADAIIHSGRDSTPADAPFATG